ncbi:hypothetical protein [Priestia flexa]|uniref:hypothetical protein n=1 Tax=Priestia flexa TaxID=86664 RepID=UPI0013D11F56|nr:hypothetical protein [Priestia flexa]
MQEIIYYPGFQINNEEWLKFALLYLKDVNTIVPLEADCFLSDTHRFLLDETNLLNSYRPTYDDITKSTEDAVWVISRELENPVKMFGVLGEINIIDFWRQPQNQNFELFQSKFSNGFEEFCQERGFAHRSNNGIKIPYQLGITYMSILAHNIGDYNDMSVITDLAEERQLRKINEKTWKYNKRFEEVKAIQKLISLEVPNGLEEIPLKWIVELRNKDGFQKKLQEFQLAVSELSNMPNKNLTEQSVYEIKQNILSTKESLKSDIIQLGASLSATILGVQIVLSDGGGNPELIKELLGVGAVANVPMIYSKVKRNWDRRLATRYLTDIKRLNRRQAGLRRNISYTF